MSLRIEKTVIEYVGIERSCAIAGPQVLVRGLRTLSASRPLISFSVGLRGVEASWNDEKRRF